MAEIMPGNGMNLPFQISYMQEREIRLLLRTEQHLIPCASLENRKIGLYPHARFSLLTGLNPSNQFYRLLRGGAWRMTVRKSVCYCMYKYSTL